MRFSFIVFVGLRQSSIVFAILRFSFTVGLRESFVLRFSFIVFVGLRDRFVLSANLGDRIVRFPAVTTRIAYESQ